MGGDQRTLLRATLGSSVALELEGAANDGASVDLKLMLIFICIEYATMFLICAAMIRYLRRNRHVALKGDATAARKVLLPAFEPLLWILGGAAGFYTVFTLSALLTGWFRNKLPLLMVEGFYCARLFVFMLVLVFLQQKSVSVPALLRSIVLTALLSVYSLLIQMLASEYLDSSEAEFYVVTGARIPIVLFVFYMAIWPPGRASLRTIREYCAFIIVFYALYIAGSVYLHRKESQSIGFALTYATIWFGSFCPIVIWRVLRADTEHWRGMGQRACALQALFRQKYGLHERLSSQGLHVLIEMHRKYIIDFAYLELRHQIGVGSSAVVFNGVLNSHLPVAVKVYTPTDFSDDTVAEFSHEAALCGALTHHPNIVTFFGMCVYPPTICLVSELCQGALGDVILASAQARRGRSVSDVTRWRRQSHQLVDLNYMLDAARAVAYLHSFSPPFLHRDIKPANFLVDVNHTVKLTDFGESRTLARANPTRVSSRPDSGLLGSGEVLSPISRHAALLETPNFQHSHSGVLLHQGQPAMTVKGTVDYMAPELINGRAGFAAYGEAADVYALAVTFWDVLYPGREKFPSIQSKNHLRVFECVVDGQRPPLDTCTDGEDALSNGTDNSENVHPAIRCLIESAWQAEPSLRPSAEYIVHVLEDIQEELVAKFSQELANELHFDVGASVSTTRGGARDEMFSGELIISRMQSLRGISTASEGVRLGNALLESGFLHHQKHARPFENAPSLYFFDEYTLFFHQPSDRGTEKCGKMRGTERELAKESVRVSSQRGYGKMDPRTPGRGRSHFAVTPVDSTCRCRRLGQRLEEPKPAAKQRLRRKFKNIGYEENVLTAKLLEEEPSCVAAPDFDDFDAIAASTA